MTQPGGQAVNLSSFWSNFNDIEKEATQAPTYQELTSFWTAYATKLNGLAQQLRQSRSNLASSSPSPSLAAQALHDTMLAGQNSLESQAQSVGPVPQQLAQLSAAVKLGDTQAKALKQKLQQVQTADKKPIADGAQTANVAQQDAAAVTSVVQDMQNAYDSLAQTFAETASALQGIPNGQWKGPGAAKGAGAGKGAAAKQGAGAGGGAGAGSSSAGGDSSTGASSGSGDSSGGADSSTPDSSATDPGLGDTGSTSSNSQPDPTTPLPDPTLAGSSTATLPPPATPNLTSTPLPTPLSTPTPITTSSSSPLPFTPLPTFSSPPPPPSPSTASAPQQADQAEVEPTLAAGESTATEASTTSGGGGFYPPMMPMSGAGGGPGGVQPGEADGAGGPAIRWQGRDSTRAGLVPELQGRGGADEDPGEEPRSRGGGLLDEELWQVSAFASPVTPPGLDPRRGRSRGY